MAFVRAASFEDLWDGEMMPCAVHPRKVLLIRLGEVVYAYEDRCAHLGVALSEGVLDGGVLTCSAHHYQYDARTGEGVNPKAVCLASFPVRVEGGEILVDVTPGAAR